MLFLLNRYLFMVYRVLMTVEIFPLGQDLHTGQVVSRFYLEMSPINTMSLDVLLILYLWSALFTRSTQMRGRASHYPGPLQRDDSGDSACVPSRTHTSVTHRLNSIHGLTHVRNLVQES